MNLKSRKLILFIICELLWTALLAKGLLTADAYANLSSIAIVGYMGGNVGEHWANRGMNGD